MTFVSQKQNYIERIRFDFHALIILYQCVLIILVFAVFSKYQIMHMPQFCFEPAFVTARFTTCEMVFTSGERSDRYQLGNLENNMEIS